MKIDQYLSVMVDPTIQEYGAFLGSYRHAVLACLVTAHSVNYIGDVTEKAAKRRRREFMSSSVSFSIIDRVAHASKHFESDRPDNPALALKASDIVEIPSGILGELILNQGPLGSGPAAVTVYDQDVFTLVNEARHFVHSRRNDP
jgi:hypothetical protein